MNVKRLSRKCIIFTFGRLTQKYHPMKNKDIKILLVDDEPDILEIISYNLSSEGYEVFTAKNGAEGVAKAKKKSPHLIIMDVMMPEMDGIEACEVIRNTPGLDNTIITFLTARGEDYSQVAGFDAGTLTSDAGALLLRVVETTRGIISRFAACFTDLTDERYVEHSVPSMVAQRVYGLCLGYEDVLDHDQLREDPLIATLCEQADVEGSTAVASA